MKRKHIELLRCLTGFLVFLGVLSLAGCGFSDQNLNSMFNSQCSGSDGNSNCNGTSKTHSEGFSFGFPTEGLQPQQQPSSPKVIINNNDDGHHHHRHHHHHHRNNHKGHGSKNWGCISGFGNKACGYGCVAAPFEPSSLYCGKEAGDNCAVDQEGDVKCGKNCVATDMSTISCDKERYSSSSAHP